MLTAAADSARRTNNACQTINQITLTRQCFEGCQRSDLCITQPELSTPSNCDKSQTSVSEYKQSVHCSAWRQLLLRGGKDRKLFVCNFESNRSTDGVLCSPDLCVFDSASTAYV
ncbi:hypothetical protein Bpfe_010101 [Biomphalaria pfeifferi]|uniref:Uncharacterized protein n=1 Tax=Biomphalaria pfeifferi TaxID=112525 RepID=A0AAD8FE85_BIOPF|nr:hypothetical protein Bpfe_010101 [Biomphalaria pfeifferi]